MGFASHFSANEIYSPIYQLYGISNIIGLRAELAFVNPNMISLGTGLGFLLSKKERKTINDISLLTLFLV